MCTRKLLSVLLMPAIVAPMFLLAACERTVTETTKTHTDSNGNVSKETKTVTQDENGNMTVTKETTEKKIDR